MVVTGLPRRPAISRRTRTTPSRGSAPEPRAAGAGLGSGVRALVAPSLPVE